MKAVSSETMRKLDSAAIHDYDVPGEVLMDRAGFAVAAWVRRIADTAGNSQAAVLLIAGRGNNGGDVFAAARYLKEWQMDVEVWLAGDPAKVTGDAARHMSRMRGAGIPLRAMPAREDWADLQLSPGDLPDIAVDGVIGTGINGPVRGPAASAIHYLRALAQHIPVIAIDIPSGLNSDTGEPEGECVRADMTVTMGMPKTGLLQPSALDYVGNIEVADIGIVPELMDTVQSDIELITPFDLYKLLPARSRNAHKGDCGHTLIIAGAPGYAGAAILSARAACRSGTGLVSVLTPESVQQIVAAGVPDAMVHSAPAGIGGGLTANALEALPKKINEYSAVLAGPGITASKDSVALIEKLLDVCRVPMVLDADALNALGSNPQKIAQAGAARVITPHPGEAARLLGVPSADIQADRRAAISKLTAATAATVILKGAGTLVQAPETSQWINLTGNPGMATGGMGDVLAGYLTGLLAQGIAPFDAARLAVFLHGRAADLCAWRHSQAGLTASDLVTELAGITREIAPR